MKLIIMHNNNYINDTNKINNNDKNKINNLH